MRTGSRATRKTQTPAGNPGTAVSAAWSGTASGCCPTIDHLLRRWKRDYAPKTPDEHAPAVCGSPAEAGSHVDYLLDVLLSPDMEERAALSLTVERK